MYSLTIRSAIVLTLLAVCLSATPAAGDETASKSTRPPRRALVGCCIINPVPAPECIPSIEEADCLAMGGVPIANVTCDGAPCDRGACCYQPGICLDADGVGETYDNCINFFGGSYLGGLRCIADDPCPICPIEDTEHCQLDDGGHMALNDRLLGARWADDFSPATSGPLERICWWPCWYNPTVPEECSTPDCKPHDHFIVRFYADADGLPGAEIGFPGGEQIVADAKQQVDGSRCWRYSAPLSTPVVLTAGECYWIELTGLGDAGTGCTVYWMNNNSSGNGYSLFDLDGEYTADDVETTIVDEASDLAFCMGNGMLPHGCGEVTGACCYPDQTCVDDVPVEDCLSAEGTFYPGETCGPDTCPIPCDNDDCPNAFDLSEVCCGGLPCSFDFTNAFCEPRASAVNCQVTPGGPIEAADFGGSKWYTWSPDVSQDVRVTMCNQANYDAILAVYDGGADCSTCPPNEANTLVCGDDTCGVGGGPPEVAFSAMAGNCYFLAIGGWNGAQGSGVVTMSSATPCPPSAERPLHDSRFGVDGSAQDTMRPCTSTADCLEGLPAGSEVDCIPFNPPCAPDGTCYVRQNRYLSIDPNPYNAGDATGRRISIDLGGGVTHVLGWISAPTSVDVVGPEPSPQWLSRIVDTPVYLDWTTLGSVHVGDCEIVPGRTYIVEAIIDWHDPNDPFSYSDALVLATAGAFGDVVGATIGDPPDGLRNFKDISAVLRGFQSVQTEPRTWLDLQGGTQSPDVPDFSDINFADINHAVGGFQGGAYPLAEPCDCPGQTCPPPARDGAGTPSNAPGVRPRLPC